MASVVALRRWQLGMRLVENVGFSPILRYCEGVNNRVDGDHGERWRWPMGVCMQLNSGGCLRGCASMIRVPMCAGDDQRE